MPTINEIKEQMIVVGSVGGFTNALQQIATLHMMRMRDQVVKSRPFVEAANEMMQELIGLRSQMQIEDMAMLKRQAKNAGINVGGRRAVIVITSNQGLTGRYNIEIYQRVEKMLEAEKDADFFVIGKKGQEFFGGGHFKVKYFPYAVPDDFGVGDLQRLTTLFDLYDHVTLVYSHYINSATHEVVAISVIAPVTPEEEVAPENGQSPVPAEPEGRKKGKHKEPSGPKFIYEPEIDDIISGVSKKLRAALFQQQILDARLAQHASQMIGMKTASDNANTLTDELRVEYNKQRRKMIDKKISEVFAGSALW